MANDTFYRPSFSLKTIKYLLVVFFCISGFISAQNMDKEYYKNSPDYYWGEATSQNELEADDNALAMLTKQIAVTVSSSFEGIVAETNTNLTESASRIINTYSSATLKSYLFLLIDFNEDLPHIYVRSWQPQEWDDDALIKLSNFNLNK